MKSRSRAIVGAALLVGSSVLAWADPWARDDVGAVMVSNRSAARRLFPGLGELSPEQANFEFQTADGERIKLQPSPDGGHVVMAGDKLLGPADPQAIGGIWSSLRMATTLRAVSPGVDVGREQGGVVRVTLQDQSLVLSLGRSAPDGSGLYGVLEHEGDEAWVVEEELAWLVTQPAEAWLSRRLADVELESLRGLSWGDQLAVVRGADGNWRSEGEVPALLSTQAVELRLDRLLNSRLDPMLERAEVPKFNAKPWLLANIESGSAKNFSLGGECPGHPDRQLVDRGPGLLGCIDAELVAAWSLEDTQAPLVESRLIPLRYQSVLAVELELPTRRTLRRRTGGWLLDVEGQTVEVIDDEAYRWFGELSLARLDVSLGTRPLAELEAMSGRVALAFSTGPQQSLRVTCGVDEEGRTWCSRDGGALRSLVTAPRLLSFDAETFEDRQLRRFLPADVRAVEVQAQAGVRQSLRRDLGAWRLDAPAHPDGDSAIDEIRVEALLAAMASLRAEAWVDAAPGEVLRQVSVDIAPAQGEASQVQLEVLRGCVGRVEGKRPFELSEGACETLTDDLLFKDPLRNWMTTSTSMQVRRPGADSTLLQREGATWVPAGGAALDPALAAAMSRWIELRTVALVSGGPPSEVLWSVDLERASLAPAAIDVGADWVSLRGANWHYALELPGLDLGAQPQEPGNEP